MSSHGPRSKRLEPLLRHAEAREDEAARVFAQTQQALEANEQRLAELRRYADEYAGVSHGAINPALLANREAFRERVQEAVGLQAQAVERSRGLCELERARLLIASRDAQVMEKLAASHRATEARHQDRRTQKELDDLAGRAYIERSRGSS